MPMIKDNCPLCGDKLPVNGSWAGHTCKPRYACACCGYLTLTESGNNTYDICPVCFWEDDPVQNNYPDTFTGANHVSLNVAKVNYWEIGACEARLVQYVRAPLPGEVPQSGLRGPGSTS